MNAITLRAPKNTGNQYCGPAAISAITGIGTAEAATVIRSVSGQRFVKGASYSAVEGALRKLGFDMTLRQAKVDGKTATLARWLKANKHMRTAGRVFLVCAGYHYQVISGRRYVCGIVKDVVSVRHEGVKRRARVQRVWEVIKTGKPSIDITALSKKRVPVDPRKRKAMALANSLDIELSKQWEGDPRFDAEYFVEKPEWLDEYDDPFYGDHYVVGWDEILGRIHEYAKLKPKA